MTLRVVIVALLLLLVVRAIRLLMSGVREGASDRRDQAAVKLVRDPVCGTHVPPRTALSLTSKGATYYFCSDECRRKFRRG